MFRVTGPEHRERWLANANMPGPLWILDDERQGRPLDSIGQKVP